MRCIETQEADLLELRPNTAGSAPTLHQQVFCELKEAKRFQQETLDKLKEVKQLLLEAKQDVENWREDALDGVAGESKVLASTN